MLPVLATLHKINNAEDWPLECREAVKGLLTSLPPLFANAANNPDDFERFVHTLDPVAVDVLEPEVQKMAVASEHIVHTVRSLGCLTSFETTDGVPRPRLPFVYAFIRTVAHVFEPSCSVLAEMPFATPRGCPTNAGVAVALVSQILRQEDIPWAYPSDDSTVVEDDDDDASSSGSSTDPRDFGLFSAERLAYDLNHPMFNDVPQDIYYDFDVWGPFLRRDEDEEHDRPSGPFLTLPPFAHLVAGSGDRSAIAIPAFVVADADNIDAVMSSALYQRHVWGIQLPVVGLCVSKYSSIVRVTCGWLDQDSLNEAGLPSVHLASAGDVTAGSFDLSTPSGCLAVSQFVSSLGNQYRAVAEAAKRDDLVECNWRADCCLTEEVSRLETTRAWADSQAAGQPVSGENISSSFSDIVDTSSTRGEDGTTETPSRRTRPLAFSQVDTRSSSLATPPNIDYPEPMIHDDSESKGKPRPIKVSADARSNSEMGALQMQSATTNHSTTHAFLWDRKVILLGRISPKNLANSKIMEDGDLKADADQIDAKIKYYDECTQFCWPREWQDEPEKTVPKVRLCDEQRMLLCDQFIRYQEVEGAVATMDEKIRQLLEPRLTSLLYSCETQDLLAAAAVGRPMNEAEMRHVWDRYLLEFYVDESSRVSPYVLLERVIQLPRNHAFDAPETPTPLESASKFARTYRTLCAEECETALDEWDELLRNSAKQDLTKRAEDIRNRARHAQNELDDEIIKLNNASPEAFAKALQARVVEEPIQGKCDATVIDSFHWGPNDGKAAAEFAKYVEPLEIGAVLSDVLQGFHEFVHGQGFVTSMKSWLDSNYPADDKYIPTALSPSIPIILLECKKITDGSVLKAVNHGYTCLVAAVEYLASLGIFYQSVFGVLADGREGAIVMAWKSEKTGITYIFERGVCILDISQPLQAVHFATILIRLRAKAIEQRGRVKQAIIDRLARAKQEPLAAWTKTAQALETPDVHNTKLFKEMTAEQKK